ncbi:hypothetical protein M2273_000987 [Mucilaginibacter lappiensis]
MVKLPVLRVSAFRQEKLSGFSLRFYFVARQFFAIGKIGPVIERDIIQMQADQTIWVIQSDTHGNDRTEVAALCDKPRVAQPVH